MIAPVDVKDRILEEASRLFARNGIKSVSMDDIAQHLGMSKKTLYKWFQNKEEIVHSSLQAQLGRIECDCEGAIGEADNAVDELFQVMRVNMKVLGEIHPSIFYDLQKYHPASWKLWLTHRNSFILSKILANLERGIREGLYRHDLDTELMARLRLSLIDLSFNPDLFPLEQFHPERVQSAFFEHFLLGIATLKGHKLINKYKHIIEEE